jgi:uncharacterized membrane protein YczE
MKFDGIRKLIQPHKTIPITPWRAQSRWDLSVSRVAILFFGLSIFGLGDALIVQSNIGNAPWTVLAQGLSIKSGFSLGLTTGLVSVVVLLLWIPLKERPGFGTISNIVLIALFIQIGISIFPEQDSFYSGIVFVFLGIALVGVGSSLYITCGLGPGPRDGAMTGIHHRTGIRVGRVRLAIESTVLVLGGLLGGNVGLGTVLFALFIGESIAISLGIVARLTSTHQ